MATPRFSGAVVVTSSPKINTFPVKALWKPAIVRSRVVLPQPELPSTAMNSPCLTVRSMRSKTGTEPYPTVRPRTSIAATTSGNANGPLMGRRNLSHVELPFQGLTDAVGGMHAGRHAGLEALRAPCRGAQPQSLQKGT